MAGIEAEAGAAVVERNAGSRHDDSRAEAAIVRLDVRDHHTLGVGGGEIDRAALGRFARIRRLGAVAADESGALGDSRRRAAFRP